MKNRELAVGKITYKQNTKSIDFESNGGIFVFPYSFVIGCENISESGIINNEQVPVGSFIQTVFSGKEAIKVVWDNSTKLTPYSENTNKLQYDFTIGDFFVGRPITGGCSSSTEISPVEGNEDFLALKSAQEVLIRFEFPEPIAYEEWGRAVEQHQLLVKDSDKRKLYKIPELGEDKWFYISNSTPVFEDSTGDIIGEEVTFATVLDQLQNTGRAIEQYVQNNAPGEPYASPKISKRRDIYGKWFKTLELNASTSTWGANNLVRFVQVEFQGSNGFSGINIIGRKLTYDDTKHKWVSDPWSWLVPSNFYQYNNNPINKTSVPTSVFNFVPDFNLKMSMTIDWMEQWKKINDALSSMQCAGRVELGAFRDWGHKENEQWIKGNPAIDQHISNRNNYEYWNQNWTPFSGFYFEGIDPYTKSLNMEGCIYTADTLSYKYTDGFENIFIKNSFVCLNNLILPTSIEQKKPYRVGDLPIIGGLVRAFIGDRTIWTNTVSKTQEGIGLFIDKTFMNWCTGVALLDPNKDLPVDAFLSSFGGEMIPKGFGATCFNTSLCYRLTDQIEQTQDGITKVVNTNYFGQKKDENGSPIFNEGTICKLQDDFNVRAVDYGFVIDKILIHGVFSGNIRISFYDRNFKPCYATTIVSNAKWLENSYNNWTSEISLGTWPSKYVSPNYKPTWPEAPEFPTETNYPIGLNFNFAKNNKLAMNPNVPERMLGMNYGWVLERYIDFNKDDQLQLIPNTSAFAQQLLPTRTYIFNYGAGYTDRDDFISKNKYLNINIDNSWYELSALDEQDKAKIYNLRNEYVGNKRIIELQPGVYEYDADVVFGKCVGDTTNEIILGSVNNTDFGSNWSDCINTYYQWYNFKFVYRDDLGEWRTYPRDNSYIVQNFTEIYHYISAHIKVILQDPDSFQVIISNVNGIIGNRTRQHGEPLYEPTNATNEKHRAGWASHEDYYAETPTLNAQLYLNGINVEKR